MTPCRYPMQCPTLQGRGHCAGALGKRQILGTGSGKRNPRPSSRETAMPPHWVSDRGGTVAINRLSGTGCKTRTRLSGPRRAQARSRLLTESVRYRKGPRGDIASHFVGLLLRAAKAEIR